MEGSGSGLAQALEADDQQDGRGEEAGRYSKENNIVHEIPSVQWRRFFLVPMKCAEKMPTQTTAT
jgi:hypothetical protein